MPTPRYSGFSMWSTGLRRRAWARVTAARFGNGSGRRCRSAAAGCRWSSRAVGLPSRPRSALVVLAFFAGRYSHRQEPIAQGGPPSQQVRDRVLLVAVGDHLERSQMVLAELVNTQPHGVADIRPEQQIASDLVGENRLYRQTAVSSGETAVASLLEDLEPLLLEIARGPSRLTAIELERFRRRVESEGMLFKIRVVGSNVREREKDKEL